MSSTSVLQLMGSMKVLNRATKIAIHNTRTWDAAGSWSGLSKGWVLLYVMF